MTFKGFHMQNYILNWQNLIANSLLCIPYSGLGKPK